MAVMEFSNGKCLEAFKIKQFDDDKLLKTDAWIEKD